MASDRRLLGLAAALFVVSLALFWPGYAMFDTLAQYRQATGGVYDDWHPPAMARLWSLVAAGGTAPMLALQLACWWLGLGLIAARIAGRRGAGVLAIGAMPLFAGWQAVVLKDTQMTAAMIAATGIVAWWRLAGRRVPIAAGAAAALLLAYATLVRANAVFATVPLAAMLSPWPRRWPARVVAAGVGVMVVLAALAPISHRLFGAIPTGVERTEAIYDLSGIAVRTGPGVAATGLTPEETVELIRRRCVRPYFWDPLGEPAHCDDTVDRLREVSPGALYATLAGAILRHPIAYAQHRLAHLNSTERWLVPWRWPGAAPPDHSEVNPVGLVSPGRAAAAWQHLAGWIAETPIGWPIAWIVLALTGLVAARAAPLAAALFVSALCLEASFALLSIASDLRYHLWPMVATAIGWALLVARAPPRRGVRRWGGVALVLVIGAGAVARVMLPVPPQTYAGMLG